MIVIMGSDKFNNANFLMVKFRDGREFQIGSLMGSDNWDAWEDDKKIAECATYMDVFGKVYMHLEEKGSKE